jgi:hypothetical protein
MVVSKELSLDFPCKYNILVRRLSFLTLDHYARAAPTLYFASKRFPAIRAIPPVQRGFLMLIATLGVGMTNAELSYEVSLNTSEFGQWLTG